MKLPKYIMTICLSIFCMMLCGTAAYGQAAISGVYPDGAHMFEPSAQLSFTASSPAGIDPTNITVQLTVTSMTGQSFIKNLTSAKGLTIGGSSTSRQVSALLSSNTIYKAVIQVTDAATSSTNLTVSFDTISGYTFEAEDYDYTSNGVSGLFFDNPQTNRYRGLDSTGGVDSQHNGSGGNSYRPNTGSSGLSTEPNGDTPRLAYTTGQQDYDLGFNNGGDFGNYTRTFPAGHYNVFLRGSGGNGPQTDCASMTVQSGNATMAGSAPFQFSVLGRGWQTYDWCPLKDSTGSLVQLTTDGTVSTLRVTIDHGNCNENFYLLLPVNTNVVASTVTISNVSPDGSALFQSSNLFTFTASAPDGINPSDITVVLTSTNLLGKTAVSNLTSGHGLTVTGPATNLSVSTPLTSNTVYSAFIQVNDASGNPASFSVKFDTVIPAYTFEAEDFDYGSGQFFDNPQTNAYYDISGNGAYDGVSGVDFHVDAQHGASYLRIGLTTEAANDAKRAAYNGTGYTDYDVGFNDGGNWGNYTRTFPAGTYNIFVRASDGGGTSSDSGSISLVTSGQHTSTQTTTKLGTFAVPSTGGWQTYTYVPVKDTGGNLVQFTGGSVQTLRATTDGGNYNANFYMLVPADVTVKVLPFINNFQPDGSSLFQPTNALSFVAHSQPGIATNNVVLKLNGAVVSGLTFSGTSNIWNVSYPVKTNAFYTAVVTLTDANGTVSSTNSFGTFSSTNYTWEAEDYDHDGGQFTDNQVDAYNQLGSMPDVDNHQNDLTAQPFNYRLNSPAPATTVAGDQARDQFTAGTTDYNIGFFGGGSWCNYTRNYPAGTYNVIGRFAEGATDTQATLSQVTGGFGTTNQTAALLGTFAIPVGGWSSWEWVPLKDNGGNLVKVTLNGSTNTLRLGGSPVLSQPEVNVNFLMLVATTPDVKLTASLKGGNISISFPTRTGSNYQVQYKNSLGDPTWTPLGSPIPGNNAVQSVSYSATGTGRFYRVQVQ